ncbi:hypothetical protein [Streptomyces sp. NPDC097610]|uniref:hypothetical protein n=1 Tax=Streptomyces sp. NPDC097610 TaxID=3157227 RepID=UPI0033293F6A
MDERALRGERVGGRVDLVSALATGRIAARGTQPAVLRALEEVDRVAVEFVALHEDRVVGSGLRAPRVVVPRETSPAEATVTVVTAAAATRIPAPATVSLTCKGDLRLLCPLIRRSSGLRHHQGSVEGRTRVVHEVIEA